VVDPQLTGIERVQAALRDLNLDAEIVSPGVPMPTVPLAAEAVGCHVDQIIKTIVFGAPDGSTIVGIANGTGRIDRGKLAAAAGVAKVKLADPGFVLDRTGYPAGGVSPIGIRDPAARVFVDEAVLNQSHVYGGAGTEDDLLRISPFELLEHSGGIRADITG
jgi:prolyl-tRNA editing enzyme YbaK/EbsC (Cys-tRNA(Pro) deacylase)